MWLILTRKENETILIGETRVMVVEVRGNQVRLGIDAPRDVPVLRGELVEREQPAEAAR